MIKQGSQLSDKKWTDIKITDRDIDLDVAGIPLRVDNRASIAQDIKHMIMASGLLIELIAERSTHKWAENTVELESLVEEDTRIIPGTVLIVRDKNNANQLWLTAKTTLGSIKYYLNQEYIEVILP